MNTTDEAKFQSARKRLAKIRATLRFLERCDFVCDTFRSLDETKLLQIQRDEIWEVMSLFDNTEVSAVPLAGIASLLEAIEGDAERSYVSEPEAVMGIVVSALDAFIQSLPTAPAPEPAAA